MKRSVKAMRELLVCSKSACAEGEKDHKYTYSILVDEMGVGEHTCESYGVKIVDMSTGTVAAVSNVTANISRIDELMDLLIRNEVSPTTLLDVLADWL